MNQILSLFRRLIGQLTWLLGRTYCVHFDYRDQHGIHHGQSLVSAFMVSRHRVRQHLQYMGYSNIHFG
jgi:hypothetical protein